MTLKASSPSGQTWTISSGNGNLINNDGLTLDGAGSGQIQKSIEGNGTVTKTGSGTWILSVANTYTGPTTVNAGTLRLGNGSNNTNLADNADVIVAAGATLHLDYSGSDTIDELFLGGVQKSPGIYSSANSPGFITGPGTLTVTNGPPSDYDSWKTASNVTGVPDDDDDHDGLSNRFEYAFGQNPKLPSGNPVAFLSPSSGPHLTYTRRKPSLTGLSHRVMTSTHLNGWTEDSTATQTVTSTTGEVETVQVTLSAALLSETKLFIRIAAQ